VATLELYRRGEAQRQVPIWRLISAPLAGLRERACGWQRAIGSGEVVEAAGAVGGGSLPEGTLAGWALALGAGDPDALIASLRAQSPPVIGHIVEDRVLLHPRTVPPEADDALIAAVRAALGR
jgi:L-seryl-tRNA(Ser) seleniumtransferase